MSNYIGEFLMSILAPKKKRGAGGDKAVLLRDITMRCEHCGATIKTSCVSYQCPKCRVQLLSDDYRPTDLARILSSQIKQA